MPSADCMEKAAIIADTKERETAEIVRLFKEERLSRTQISRLLGLAFSTVSDRLAAAGFPKGPVGRIWTEAENAILAEAAEDPKATAKSLAQRLPGRHEATISEKLRAARLTLGIKPAQRKLRPMKTGQTEQQPTGFPDWPLPRGAYRNNQGITLPRLSILAGPDIQKR